RLLSRPPPRPAGAGPGRPGRGRHRSPRDRGPGLPRPRRDPAPQRGTVRARATGVPPGPRPGAGSGGRPPRRAGVTPDPPRSGISPRSPSVGRDVTCAICGTVAVVGARFCHHCGAALPEATTLPATERRVVTVLFGDLSDFTAWSADLDPERVGAVVDLVLAALAGAVQTFGGHVDKLTGVGIMAVFGAPVAHADDAEGAVRAALAMQRSVRRVLDDERGGGAPLGLRVGLNTGMVVAG